ncbi:GerAB/ArcD/ProY family transporter [Niallia sp. 01092]|uniref:GerAB/ArcD/ProY family transporter n=1 Tax=unclassified Niallia TaxID=2837522 RepID=UPI003FD6BB85
MLENGKISSRQLMVLVILFNIGTTILLAPGSFAFTAQQDGWVASIFGVAIGLLFVLLYNGLGKLFPEFTLVQISEKVLGKWVGKIVSLLFMSYFFLICPFLLNLIGNFLTTAIMPETPIQAIYIIFMATIIMGTRLGLETFTRSAELFFPWIMIGIFILCLAISPKIEIANIQPVLEANSKTILKANYQFIGILYLELIIFLMLFPFINQKKGAGKALFLGTLIGGIVTILITFLSISVLGAEQTSRNIYSTFSLAKKINLANFVTRIEIILAGIWFISIFFKLLICFYAFILGIAQILELKDYRVLVFPFGIILIVFTLLSFQNIVYFYFFSSRIWTSYALTYGLVLPLLLLGVAAVRKIRLPLK